MPTPTIGVRNPDTFRVPTAPSRQGPRTIGSGGTSGAFQLANALSRLNPAVQGFLRTSFDFYKERERARADEFSRTYQGDYAEAVRKGDLPAGASPFFREQVLRNEVRGKAQSYQMWLRAQWQNDGSIKGAGEDQYKAWVEGKTQEYVQNELNGYSSELLSDEFDPRARNVQNNLASHHIADGYRRTKQRAIEGLNNGVSQDLRSIDLESEDVLAKEFVDNGGDLGSIQRVYQLREQVALQRIQQRIEEGHAVGLTYEEMNRSVVDSVALRAEQTGDLSEFNVLDQLQTGTGKLGNTQYAQAVRLETSNRLAQKERAETRFMWAEEDRAKQVRRENAQAAFIIGIMEAESPQERMAIFEASVAENPDLFASFSSAMSSVGVPISRNPEQTLDFLDMMSQAQSGELQISTIQDRFAAGDISDDQAYTLTQEAQSSRNNLTATDRSNMERLSNTLLSSSTDQLGRNSPEQIREANRVKAVYAQEVNRARQEGKPMGTLELLELEDKLAERYYRAIGETSPTEDPGAPSDNAEASSVSPTGEPQEAAQEAPEAQETAIQTNPEGHPQAGFPVVSDEAVTTLLQNLRNANVTDPTGALWEEERDAFNRDFGPGAAEAIILRDQTPRNRPVPGAAEETAEQIGAVLEQAQEWLTDTFGNAQAADLPRNR